MSLRHPVVEKGRKESGYAVAMTAYINVYTRTHTYTYTYISAGQTTRWSRKDDKSQTCTRKREQKRKTEIDYPRQKGRDPWGSYPAAK